MVWLQEQLNSIAAQTFRGFRCVVSHDGPIPISISDQIYAVLPDSRFKLVLNSKHLGTYKHVDYLISEFGMMSKFFALCDQDDVWLPKKLESQLSRFSHMGVTAVSSNGLIVNDALQPIRGKGTFDWFGITQKYEHFGSVRNQLTGASGLFRSDRLNNVTPFPENTGETVHDHWLYIAAVATGGVFFDSEPQWLYRQHNGNQIGAAANSGRLSRLYKGAQKTKDIFRNRCLLKDDPVIRQGRVFLDAANERWPSGVLKNDVLSRELSGIDRIRLLRSATLIGSSLESLRVAISQQK
jgi:hypothetical protein